MIHACCVDKLPGVSITSAKYFYWLWLWGLGYTLVVESHGLYTGFLEPHLFHAVSQKKKEKKNEMKNMSMIREDTPMYMCV